MGKEKHINNGSNIKGNAGNIFGFDATIVLFLENARECSHLSTEDADDIRLAFKNGKGDLVAQAKSSFVSNQLYDADHFSDIHKSYKAFERITNDKRNEVGEYAIVFNFRKPFGDSAIIFGPTISKYQKYNFVDLPDGLKNKLTKYYKKKNYSFSLEDTSFIYICYEGDETTRNQYIIDRITEFIKNTNLDINPRTLYNAWFEIISRSSTYVKEMESVDKLIGTAFITSIRPSNIVTYTRDFYNGSFSFEESILQKEAVEFLKTKEIDFSSISKIKSAYFKYLKNNTSLLKTTPKKQIIINFVKEYVSSNSIPLYYQNLFKGKDNQEELQSVFYQIMVFYTIAQQDSIKALEEAFGL